jgi:membrane-associated phospholipid phosphatase
LLLVALMFAVAGAVDLATGQRHSQVWGSIALLAGAWALLPAWRRLALSAGAYVAVWVLFNLARAIGDEVAWRDRTIDGVARFESALAGGTPGEALQRVGAWLPGTPLLEWALVAVYLSYFVVPHLVAVWLLVRRRADFGRLGVAGAALFAIGAALFAAVPTAPPWLAAEGELERLVPRLTGIEASGRGYDFDPNPVASMPSIHLGVTALLVPVARPSWLRALALGYVVAMGVALVYLAEHHVLDVVAGAAAAAAAWRLARGLTRPGALPRIGERGRMGRPHRLPAS